MSDPKPIDLKDTLNLPKTNFPMRADLVNREPITQTKWDSMGLYEKVQAHRAGAPAFVLHDGPPFTNGDIHVGTAFNKILKDTILRYKNLKGFRTPFIPGWDCHGLPIEHKVSRDLEAEKKTLDAAGIRKACAAFSAMHRDKQRAQSQRLGLLADWKHEYQTMDPVFEAGILRTFAAFVEGGYVYRSKKPVYWSIPCKTALAEGEVEYQDITSPALWVKFPIVDAAALGLNTPTCVVIWTTTPWTLPANLAIALHPELTYVALQHEGQSYIVAEGLAAAFIEATDLKGATPIKTFSGQSLEGTLTRHPFIERPSPIVLANYVSADTGTGCVHTAPGHGLDDYFTGNKYGLEVYSPINDEGCYINDGKVPPFLVGLSVLTTKGKNTANIAVIEHLKSTGLLLKHTPIVHAYPHCWRSKTPVIFRAMDQWFIALDHNDLRQKMLGALGNVTWTPKTGENRMRGSLESRPDWCITRQRAWGTPMPIFYDETGTAYLDGTVIRALADKIAITGTDVWFTQPAETLLEGIPLPESWKGKNLKSGTDTLDVWLDSGSSHIAVLKARKDLHWPADLYLEGSDQHRGWFQSSLWTAMVTEGQPPYRHVLTHGFITDEDRQKISKSGTKPQTASEYVKRFGADVLRLWVASEDYQADVPLSETILAQVTQVYRTIRNTLRFQLGNLYDFDPASHAVAWEALLPLDQWALRETARLIEEVTTAYEAFALHRAYQALSRFVTVTLSAIYHDILKDRLYVAAPHWAERRSAQTALHTIFHILVRLLSPTLVHTAEEAFGYAMGHEDNTEDSIHLQDWPTINPAWFNESIAEEVGQILAFREQVHAALEPLRQEKVIGQSSDAQITITGSPDDLLFALLTRHSSSLVEFFIVSQVRLSPVANAALSIEAARAEGFRCPRSWKWVPELVPCPGYEAVSPRSKEALQSRVLFTP